MAYLSEPHAWLFALMIFALRVVDMSLDTIRVLFVVRGKKLIVWVLGFFQSLVFVVAISSVLTQLNNILNVIGYATGFATGNLVGMLIEQRLAIGHILITIISSSRGSYIAEQLRSNGYAVTEIAGRPAIIPKITGRAWTFGLTQLALDPFDPTAEGFAVTDVWGPEAGEIR